MKPIHIKNLRELKNLSQSYVADKIGISQSYYSKLESGASKLTPVMIESILNILENDLLLPIFNTELPLLDAIKKKQMEYDYLIEIMKTIETRLQSLESKI